MPAPITFYATIDADKLSASVQGEIPAVPVLLPASSFYRRGFPTPRLPAHVRDRAVDSGGFVATFKWGDYRYTPAEYVAWCARVAPQWAATMDYCCEPEVLDAHGGLIAERQARTTAMAVYFWHEHRAVPWVWVPTIQGWDAADYATHARALAPLIAEMRAHYGPESAFRVGIGTLCRRASPAQIRTIVRTCAAILPGVRFHLWGVKLQALQSTIALPDAVCSVDSAAWHGCFGRDMHIWKASGLRRSVYYYRTALPKYLDKIALAQAGPKQTEMHL